MVIKAIKPRFFFSPLSERAAIKEFIWLFMLALSIQDRIRLLTPLLDNRTVSTHIVFIGDKNQVDM